MTTAADHRNEIATGSRFEFGKNWARFLRLVDDDRVQQASGSLCRMLGVADLVGRRFLDIGSGSGLFSLAARRLGAVVRSFDYDPASVACTEQLRSRYLPNDASWSIDRGSVLDRDFINSLGMFDVVYSWGVLHHTGKLYQAIENAVSRVAPNGQCFIAIYNDQGWRSTCWRWVKRGYNKSVVLRWLAIAIHAPYLWAARRLVRALTRRGDLDRGMSVWRDMIDWLGGYPFEVAKPEEMLDVFRRHGFSLERLKTCGGRMGCNEYVFRREVASIEEQP